MTELLGYLRATVRLLLLPLVTIPLVSILLVGSLLRTVWPSAGWPMFRWAIRTWARGILWVMGVRVEVDGCAPAPPFFLVSNHLSYLDIPVLHSQLSGHFLSKAEIASWPIAGWLARMAGTLFVDRTRRRDLARVIPEVETLLRAGNGVVIFPEGTSSSGAEVLPFKPSLFEVPLRTGVAVSQAALQYRLAGDSPAVAETVCWWGEMPFASHFLKLLTLPGVDARVSFGSAPLVDDDRKRLSDRARQAVLQEFRPTSPPHSATNPAALC